MEAQIQSYCRQYFTSWYWVCTSACAKLVSSWFHHFHCPWPQMCPIDWSEPNFEVHELGVPLELLFLFSLLSLCFLPYICMHVFVDKRCCQVSIWKEHVPWVALLALPTEAVRSYSFQAVSAGCVCVYMYVHLQAALLNTGCVLRYAPNATQWWTAGLLGSDLNIG